jgi:hypothetical protein
MSDEIRVLKHGVTRDSSRCQEQAIAYFTTTREARWWALSCQPTRCSPLRPGRCQPVTAA